jgi:hypothetical protein
MQQARVGILMALLLVCQQAFSKDDLYFSGVAFTGNFGDLDEVAPYSSQLLDEAGTARLNVALKAALQNAQDINLVIESLASLDGTTSQKAIAVSIDRDIVVEERVASEFKNLYEIAAQLLVYDYASGLIMEAKPITIQLIDISSQPKSDDEHRSVFESLIFDGALEGSLVTQVAAAAAELSLNPAQKRLKINGINLAAVDSSQVNSRFADVLGHELTKILFSRISSGVLPYASGGTIGNTMRTRFSDGRIFDFKVPEPDYLLDVTVDKTVVNLIDPNTLLLGAFLTIKVYQPQSLKEYVNVSFKFGTTKTISADSDVDEPSLVYEVILQSFDKFVGSVEKKDREWIGAQDDSRKVSRQIDELVSFTRGLK